MNDSLFDKHPSVVYRNADVSADTTEGGGEYRQAAVLIPLIKVEGEWEILYIRRTERDNDRHSGQVAFPGGAAEKQDSSPVATALRETHEEIGIKPEDITVLHTIDTYVTISDFQVTPVVGVIKWPTTLIPQPEEVSRIFSIPLHWLRQQDNFEVRARVVPSPTNKRNPVIYFKTYDGELLWGATARMTLNLIKALDEEILALPD